MANDFEPFYQIVPIVPNRTRLRTGTAGPPPYQPYHPLKGGLVRVRFMGGRRSRYGRYAGQAVQEMKLPTLRLLRGGMSARERLGALLERTRRDMKPIILAALREGDTQVAECAIRGRDELGRIEADVRHSVGRGAT